MISINNIKMRPKLIGLFLMVGLVPLAIVAYKSTNNADDALMATAYNQLKAVREIKKDQIINYNKKTASDVRNMTLAVETMLHEAEKKFAIVGEMKKNQLENYFSERYGDIHVLSRNETVVDALKNINQAFVSEGHKINGSQWKQQAKKYAPWLEYYNKEYDYYDLFLISNEGNVVFSAFRESDLGENLVDGTLKTSGLGRLFQKALKEASLEDFAPYAPSKGAYASFIGAPVKDGDKIIGVVALQMPKGSINRIVQEGAGTTLGKSGENYLVGLNKGEISLRSDRVVKSGKIGKNKSTDLTKMVLIVTSY